ncbi:MAG: esterase-like activity of phytase family protein [Hahellaceae bacterium]|nr:esterase-like activity of phytase family protein [Hahellaceae bacterium]MCP5169187.1 esterase-like activity of phytase family protein [Hahellaceae bacterium]
MPNQLVFNIVSLLCCLLIFVTPERANAHTTDSKTTNNRKLKLIQAYELAYSEAIEPSGLSYCDGRLLMISDKQDSTVFEIPPTTRPVVKVRPYVHLPVQLGTPQKLSTKDQLEAAIRSNFGKRYDWEGLSCDSQNRLWLASEFMTAVLRYDPKHKKFRWITQSLTQEAQKHGFVQDDNAGIEGLAVGHRMILLAFERQPYGFAWLKRNRQGNYVPFKWQQKDPMVAANAYLGDISDVLIEKDRMYTLGRSLGRICRRSLGDAAIQRCWSYSDIENSDEFRYADNFPGHAEGMARHKNRLYLVMDNNGSGRMNDKANRNPLLFIFQVPKDW